ncbi:MAG: hypothetical protein ACLPN5_11785 [Roseiarcus sp.]
MLRIIAICNVISTIILVAGALVFINDRFQLIGALLEWNKERLESNLEWNKVRLEHTERHDYFTYQYNKAIELVGVEKSEFIKRVCAPDNPNDEVDRMNTCITSIAEARARKCSDAFSVYRFDVRAAYEREKAAGTISFACE